MAKAKKKKMPEKTMKDINDFLEYVGTYWNETQKNNFSRYMSWEHCYEHFQETYSKVIAGETVDKYEMDSLALWLAWYLASWGMYRGSSGLLNHSYEVHRKVIALLLDKRWASLNNIECRNWNDDVWKLLEKLRMEIRGCYDSDISVTDTLVTKIMLGTLGCTPAFDNLFVNSISFNSEKKEYLFKSHIRNYNKCSMKELCAFYNEILQHPMAHSLRKMKTKTKNLPYPQMKILDMGFWNFWKKETNDKET